MTHTPCTPNAAPSDGRGKILHGLTSLRGLAAWWVVLYHFREFQPEWTPPFVSQFLGRGYLAVDFFFELSGYVIALNYLAGHQTFSLRGARHFLGLRLARVYPLHVVMLCLMLANPLAIALFSTSAEPGPRYDPGYYVLSLLMIQNWGFTRDLAWNIPAWSISTEFGAYLAFPFMARTVPLLARKLSVGLATITGALALLAVLAARQGGLNADIAHSGLARCLLEFFSGCLLLALTQAHELNRRWLQHGAMGLSAGLMALLIAGVLPDEVAAPPAMLLILFVVQGRPGWTIRLLERPWLIRAGEVSYATYMFHYLAKDWVKFTLAGRPDMPDGLLCLIYVVMVMAGSVLFHRTVEVPGRAFLRRALN